MARTVKNPRTSAATGQAWEVQVCISPNKATDEAGRALILNVLGGASFDAALVHVAAVAWSAKQDKAAAVSDAKITALPEPTAAQLASGVKAGKVAKGRAKITSGDATYYVWVKHHKANKADTKRAAAVAAMVAAGLTQEAAIVIADSALR